MRAAVESTTAVAREVNPGIQVDVLREIPIGSAPAEKVEVRESCLSGALSIGRFVVSRWQVCGGRGPMGIEWQAGVASDLKKVEVGQNTL